MINEPHIHQRYLHMSIAELQSRSRQLDAEREHMPEKRMSHGMSVYRRRLMRALRERDGELMAQRTRHLQSQAPELNTTLSAQQLYDRGMDQGNHDALRGLRSRGNELDDPNERRGYHDGYRSTKRIY